MKKIYNKVIATVGILAVCTTAAEATPAFARQMNTECMTCHSQNVPKLNSFGRDFKLSGFTMNNGGKEVTGDKNGGVAVPSNLNMGFVIKARHLTETNAAGVSGTNHSKIEILDESAFIFGGKISENIGTSLEYDGADFGGKFIFSKATDFGRLGMAYYNTSGLGAFSGLEVYSTGLYRPVRQFENRKKANIMQKLGIGDGAATGVQAYYSGSGFFATVGQYVPVFSNSTDTQGIGYKTLARLSYELNLGGFNVAVGGYSLGGDVVGYDPIGNDADAFNRDSTGIDFQVEGDVSNMSLMVTGGIVLSNEYTSGGLSSVKDSDETGFSVGAQLNVLKTLGVKLAYLSSTDNADTTGNGDETSMTLGLDYSVAQNVRFVLEYSDTAFSDSTLSNETDILLMSMIAF